MEKKFTQRPEFYLSVISLLLSLAAFLTSAIQTNIMHKQQKASAWPFLEISNGIQSDDMYLRVINKGVGPAIIKKATFSFEGKEYDTAMQCAKAMVNDTSFHEWRFTSFPINKSVIASNETIETLLINDLKFVYKILEKGKSFSFKIRYASIYGDEWETDGTTTIEVK
jgi:hypothetical protein